MRANSPFEPDDYGTIAEEQPSGYIDIADDLELSQNAWYDIEGEESSIGNVRVRNNPSQRFTTNRYNTSQYSSQRQAKPGNYRATRSASPRLILRRFLSIRTILLLVALLAIASGIAFAKGVSVPPIIREAHVSSPPTRPAAPATNPTKGATKKKPTPIPTPVPIVPTPLPINPTPAPTNPTPAPTSVPPANPGPTLQNLPPEWAASNRQVTDAMEAMAVAETFTQRYETIDFRSPATLNSSRFVLTAAANDRFVASDKRGGEAFATQMQQQQLVQTATVTGTQIVKAQSSDGQFFAWIRVTYQLATQKGQGNVSISDVLPMNVLLVAVPFATPQNAPPMGGIGWLVSDFKHGSSLPVIPATP